VDGPARTVLWLVALAIDYGAPLVLYAIPGRPVLRGGTWNVETGHFSERFGLFLIITLGESIVITGAVVDEAELSASVVLAFATAFLSTAALWWLYFTVVQRVAEERLAHAADRTAMARDAYTYGHVLLVAGIIGAAVGDELILAHPTEPLPGAQVAAVVGGPALYLVAHSLFRLRIVGSTGWRRPAGAAALVVLGLVGSGLEGLVLGALVLLVLVAVIVGDQVVSRRTAAAPAV
jgi:low temperature requirement protein LtrA